MCTVGKIDIILHHENWSIDAGQDEVAGLRGISSGNEISRIQSDEKGRWVQSLLRFQRIL